MLCRFLAHVAVASYLSSHARRKPYIPRGSPHWNVGVRDHISPEFEGFTRQSVRSARLMYGLTKRASGIYMSLALLLGKYLRCSNKDCSRKKHMLWLWQRYILLSCPL